MAKTLWPPEEKRTEETFDEWQMYAFGAAPRRHGNLWFGVVDLRNRVEC